VGDKWAQRESFENTRDLLGDLLGAKNVGVTVPQLFHWAGHQSQTKVSSGHQAHNEPKNLSPDITKEGLSLSREAPEIKRRTTTTL
jgi:hypothetical protein